MSRFGCVCVCIIVFMGPCACGWADGPVLHGQPQSHSFCAKKAGYSLTLTHTHTLARSSSLGLFFAGAVLAGI